MRNTRNIGLIIGHDFVALSVDKCASKVDISTIIKIILNENYLMCCICT